MSHAYQGAMRSRELERFLWLEPDKGRVKIHNAMEYTVHMQCIHSSQHGMHSPMHTCIMHTQMMFMLAHVVCNTLFVYVDDVSLSLC